MKYRQPLSGMVVQLIQSELSAIVAVLSSFDAQMGLLVDSGIASDVIEVKKNLQSAIALVNKCAKMSIKG